jgi:hypothetical protein
MKAKIVFILFSACCLDVFALLISTRFKVRSPRKRRHLSTLLRCWRV